MAAETLAFSPEIARQAMLQGLVLPRRLVRKAVRRLDQQLSATTMKFFAHEGVVVDSREVIDNDAQLRAIDTTLKVAGLYAPRAMSAQSQFGVAIEIDPASGVIRVVAGLQTTQQSSESGLRITQASENADEARE